MLPIHSIDSDHHLLGRAPDFVTVTVIDCVRVFTATACEHNDQIDVERCSI
jgi:hypothetical protein